MILLRDIFSCVALDDAIATTRASWAARPRQSRRGISPLVCVASRGRGRSVFLSCVLILFSSGAPFLLSGCLGGQIIGANASTGSLRVSPNSVSFGSVPLGTTTSTSVSLVNQGSAAVQVSQVSLAGQSFTVSGAGALPITVAAGGTLSMSVNFSPAAMGAATGELTISSNAANDGTVVVGLSGTGTSAPASNTTNLSSLSCDTASMTGAGVDSCTVTLAAAAPSGGTPVNLSSNDPAVVVPATVTVPGGAIRAVYSAAISSVSTAQTAILTASAGGVSEEYPLQLNVAAAGLNINATSVAFGTVPVNTAVTQSVAVTASGRLPFAVTAAVVQGAGFSISGATFPLALTDGQSATIDVTFDPTAAGASTGQLIIVSTSLTGGETAVSLSGTGELVEVNLSWDAPASSPDPVAGYNVYRAPGGGTSYQLLSSVSNSQLAYTDTGVQAGLTYNYIVESVDTSGVTSAPSNMASVTLP